MATDAKIFRININRFRKAAKKGFTLLENGHLAVDGSESAAALFFSKIDSGEKDTVWGRFSMDMDIESETVFNVYAFASDNDYFLRNGLETKFDDFFMNPDEPFVTKFKAVIMSGGKKFSNVDDLLLSSLQGRYLWIGIEIIGSMMCEIKSITVFNPGDVFLKTFPEIYKNQGDFFGRYLSIFSSLYMDFDRRIEALPNLVDPEKAPLEVLPILADWMGIKIDGGFLEEEKMRELLKNGYRLSRIKGTRRAVSMICRLILGEEPIIIEKSRVGSVSAQDKDTYDKLYSSDPYSFTIIIRQHKDEKLYAQLKFLIEQFKPARSKAKIIFLDKAGNLNSYCYLDMNAFLSEYQSCELDRDFILGENIRLE
ncbi:MAG: hypothetical protein K6F52_06745 [Clostridia bacterium]|nr:hypothetical protein [Clostridia bacterium]